MATPLPLARTHTYTRPVGETHDPEPANPLQFKSLAKLISPKRCRRPESSEGGPQSAIERPTEYLMPTRSCANTAFMPLCDCTTDHHVHQRMR